jgi:4-amino-4-deoxy-L-arabinose transferase-like glycosyltransferase
VLLALAVVGAALILLAAVHGALGAARNDDWSYYRVVFNFERTHRFHLDGWIQMMLIGHTLLGWPVVAVFGRSIIALQVLGLAAAMAGLVCGYALLRRFLTPAWSATACLTLLIGPVLGSLAISYMTDTTAFAAQMAALLFGVKALEAEAPARSPWLLAAGVSGLLAFSIREVAIVAFLVVLAVAIAQRWREPTARRRLLVIAAVFLAAAGAALLWSRSLPNTRSIALDLRPGPGDIRQLGRAALTFGLSVSPVALVVSPLRAWSAAWRSARGWAAAALVLGASCAIASRVDVVGNYVTSRGSYPNATVVAVRPDVIPDWLFALTRLLAVYGLLVGLLVLARVVVDGVALIRADGVVPTLTGAATNAPARTVFGAFACTLTVGYVVVIVATNQVFFDRYLIILVVPVAGLFLHAALQRELLWRAPLRVAAGALAAYAVIGFVYVDAAATIDGAKWRTAEKLVTEGLQPATIDGGYEWFGFHQPDDTRPGWENGPGNLGTRLFSPRPVCATVLLNGTDRAAREAARPFDVLQRSEVQMLFDRDIVVLGVEGPDRCRQPVR